MGTLHIDDGFNTPVATDNIQKLCSSLNIELITIRLDEEQYNDLIRSYVFAGVPNLAAPQDNILLASLYKYAKMYRIKYFLSGGNFALESILQRGNTHSTLDLINLKDIHKRFGELQINKLDFLTENKRIIDRFVYGIKTAQPLNYIDYNREIAIQDLKTFCDFNYYGGKHLENALTKFLQIYWLYHKFGVDKRKSHLSSLIISGQMTRDEALLEMKKPIYNTEEMEKDLLFVLNKLKISKSDFDKIMDKKGCQHSEYRTSGNNFLNIMRKSSFFNKIKKRLQP